MTHDPYRERMLTDGATRVTVFGRRIHEKAKLEVTGLNERNARALETLCEWLRLALESDARVSALRIALQGVRGMPAWLDTLTVSIPVDGRYNGKPLLVRACAADGSHALYGGGVENGMLSFDVTKQGNFVVFDPSRWDDVHALLREGYEHGLHQSLHVTDEARAIVEAAYTDYLARAGKDAKTLEAPYLLQMDVI